MKIDVKRVISKFRLEVSQTAREAAKLLVSELLFDLDLLNLREPYKISGVVPFSDQLVKVKIEEATDLVQQFNSLIETFFINYKEQFLKWNKPNTLDFKSILLQEINEESEKLKEKLLLVSVKGTHLLKDFDFLKINYKVNKTQLNKMETLKLKLKLLVQINRQAIVNSIKSGKLPII